MTEPRESTPWDVRSDAARRPGYGGLPHGRAWLRAGGLGQGCVGNRCQGIIDSMPKRFEEWDKDLTLIKAANRELGMAELTLRHQVAVARRHGHSWAAIGFVLDITRQAAQQRFGTAGETST